MPKSRSRPANSTAVQAKPVKSGSVAKPTTKKSSSKKNGVKIASKAKDSSKPASEPVELATPQLLKDLVHNDEEVRTKAFDAVRQKLKTKRELTVPDLLKLWKGLWYTMWHSDTPLVQQALARELAATFELVAPRNYSAFTASFWQIMVREWETLDKWRLNKFYMLIRFVLGASLARIGASQWDSSLVTELYEVLTDATFGPLSFGNVRIPHSLRLHLVDIYLSELTKVVETSQPETEVLKAVLRPVTDQIEFSEFKHVKQRVREEVLEDPVMVEWGLVEAPQEEVSEESEFEGFD